MSLAISNQLEFSLRQLEVAGLPKIFPWSPDWIEHHIGSELDDASGKDELTKVRLMSEICKTVYPHKRLDALRFTWDKNNKFVNWWNNHIVHR